MKLRIRGNSLRLRLGESEVDQLISAGRVSESIVFSAAPSASLTYTLDTSPDAREITVRFASSEITVTIPGGVAKEWATSERVGLSGALPISDEMSLAILIEKDFRCLTPRLGEDQSDSYPNPAEGQSCNHP